MKLAQEEIDALILKVKRAKPNPGRIVHLSKREAKIFRRCGTAIMEAVYGKCS